MLWGKNKEGKVVPCNKVNTMHIISVQNDQEHEKMEEKGREEQKQATSASVVENV